MKQETFPRLWDNDPYAAKRAGAVRWLGERWLLAQPLKRLDRRPDDGKLRIR